MVDTSSNAESEPGAGSGARWLGHAVWIAVASLAGAALLWLPPRLMATWREAQAAGPVWVYLYAGSLIGGAVLLLGAVGWTLVLLARNSRRKRRTVAEAARPASSMSPGEIRRQLESNREQSRKLITGADDQRVRRRVEAEVASLDDKLTAQRLEIAAFGTISSGKSSVLNALAGRDLFTTAARGGTTTQKQTVDWPGHNRVVLVDTPGLGEVAGPRRAATARDAAQDADLVVLVVDGPLRDYEHEALGILRGMDKRVLICLNKLDWFTAEQQADLLEQLREQAAPIDPDDVVAVRAAAVSRRRVRVLADGTEQAEESVLPADISPLADRLLRVVDKQGERLLLANLLLRSRALLDETRAAAAAAIDRRARELVERYTWVAGTAGAVNPLPGVDVAVALGVSARMTVKLAQIYDQPVDYEAARRLLDHLTKNLLAVLGAHALTPVVTTTIASLAKTTPGLGTVAGGLLQGLTQALVTRWLGSVFIVYFRNEMQAPRGGLAELARQQWQELTRRDRLAAFIREGASRLSSRESHEAGEGLGTFDTVDRGDGAGPVEGGRR